MIFTTLKRITRTGFVNFWRNGFLTFAAVIVITLSLGVFGGMIFVSAFGRTVIADVKEKVDINVYFVQTAAEQSILALKGELEALPEVSRVEYISRDQVFEQFKAKWKDNALIMQGLDEIGANPFSAVLNIKAKNPGQYGSIAKFLETKDTALESDTGLIEKVNYQQNKLIIDRLGRLIPAIEKAGAIAAGIFIAVAIIIVFNTIRLIIYTAREEISVMKLVGASNMYVRGPLVVSGIMYGIAAGIITLVLMAVVAYWGDAIILRFAGVQVASDFEIVVNVLSRYFVQNFAQIFILILGAGVILGGVSSYIAARRYLKV
jgi:cell division transport system permease protein